MEARMTDNARATAATMIGAALGGIVGYLFFTEQGRSARRQIERALEDFARDFTRFRGTVQQATGAVHEGWTLLSEKLDDGTDRQPRYPSAH
jgi:hypothetical protein